jgi:hypothetical protein
MTTLLIWFFFFYLVTIPLRRAIKRRRQAMAQRAVAQPGVRFEIRTSPSQAPMSMLQPKLPPPGYLNWSPTPSTDPRKRGIEK